jgi:carbon monoxide dehydrogenase subunit G
MEEESFGLGNVISRKSKGINQNLFINNRMAISKYVSDVKQIPHNQEVVFQYLSDFRNLSEYLNQNLFESISRQIPQIKISQLESDRDSCRFQLSGVGLAGIQIVKRDPFQTIKIESSEGLPVSITLWIQLLPGKEGGTKMRLTLHADMSMMLKIMADKKLAEGINTLADTMAGLPYPEQ